MLQQVTDHPLSAPTEPAGATSKVAQPEPPYAPPPPPPDAVESFLGGPVPPRPPAEHSVPQTQEGVLVLAKAGAWRAAASLCERLLSHSHPVDVLLLLRWYHVVALLRLREVGKAERELAMLGDLRSGGWLYERYPGIYPSKSGTMVPFALLVLHALLPSYSGNHDHALARLYTLLDAESTAASKGAAPPSAAGKAAEAVSGSLGRRSQVVLALVNVLCAVHDYPNAVAHLEQLIAATPLTADAPPPAEPPTDALQSGFGDGGDAHPVALSHLLSLLGRLHLQLGNLQAADDSFARLESLVPTPDQSAVVRVNRGLHAMATSQYTVALDDFRAALAIAPTNVLAANNAAVCQLYCCKLNEAVGTLEGQLRADPRASMHPALVANLATLYQMTSPTAASSTKGTLERLVMATAADDFDHSALQMQ